MAQDTETWFTLSDGLKVFERTWEPSTPAKAHLIVMHGFSDHASRYANFAKLLTQLYPIRVTGWDRRGWGKTVRNDADKGLTGDSKQLMADIHEYLQHVETLSAVVSDTTEAATTNSNLPLFVTGHSMGGQELLWYLLSGSSPYYSKKSGVVPKIAGIVLNAPYVALVVPPPSLALKLGRKAAWLSPNKQIKNEPNPKGLSHDEEGIKEWLADPLCHDTGTLRGIVATFDREEALSAFANGTKLAKGVEIKSRLPVPVMWGHGTEDGACRFDLSKKLFDRLEGCEGGKPEDKVFKAYDGWFHQLNSEPGESREVYARDVGDWIVGVLERSS